jgi:Fur family transcriptional regulator, ferric uptake regulator
MVYNARIDNGYQYHAMRAKPTDHLASYLTNRGLRATRQRDDILRIFVDARRHVSADELYELVRKAKPGIGHATVYRTLRLFAEAGLAHERRFADGFLRYEYAASDSHHHHLICTLCGVIIEFQSEKIEQLQRVVAKRNRFLVQSHKLDVYGLCAACQGKQRT